MADSQEENNEVQTSADADTANNPYLSTYLKNHKDINLPKDFGLETTASGNSKNNRTDYKTLRKVNLFTIKDILSASDCNTLIDLTNKIGYVPISFEYPEDYRKCERVICKSYELASIIWKAIIPYFNRNDIENIRPYGFGNKGIWRPTHINEAIRFTRYRDGDFFKPHRDGGYTRSNLNRSVYTIMIYLNDSNEDFSGGQTIFYSLQEGTTKDSNDPKQNDLFLTDDDMKMAEKVEIKPVVGMAVIFNHDVWHQGCKVITNKDDKHKFILRSDIMFECYNCETFNRNNLINDPLYIKAQMYYKKTIDLQNEGRVRESTISYLKALSLQAMLPSVIVDKDETYYGEEFYWFTNDIYEYILSFLDVYRLMTACYVSRAWYYYATSPNLWKTAYQQHFNINEIQSVSTNINTENTYNTLFRPWKHIFAYRVMVKNQFPIIVLNFWLNGIEIGSTSRRKDKKKKKKKDAGKYYNHYQQLMDKDCAQYIPFATSEYYQSNAWSWKPHRKEILYGRIIYTNNYYGFRKPEWIIDQHGMLNGLSFYKLLKQILYFPNVVLSLPSIMYDNKLFILYLKYMLTKFNGEKFSKIFCLMIKNMEEEIAKYYKHENCIIVLNEHRSFSIAVIKNGERIIDKKCLMKKFIATQDIEDNEKTEQSFPNLYYHYRDDYDMSFYIANAANFDFINSINDKTNILKQNVSDEAQRAEAMPQLEPYRWSRRRFKYINESNSAPQPLSDVVNVNDKKQDLYYKIGQKNDTLQSKMEQRMKKYDNNNLNTLNGLELLNELANDMFVGPNKGKKIPQNDFTDLSDRWNQNVYPQQIESRDIQYYVNVKAPFNLGFCYSAFDLILALNDVVKECNNYKIFEEEKKENEENEENEEKNEIPVIMVGSMENFYGDFISEFCDLCNDDKEYHGVKLKYIDEYVQNEGTTVIKDRSSALKQILKSIVTPQQISNFESISKIKNEIIQNESVK